MHLVSVCKEPSDHSPRQTFQFINLLSEHRCQNRTRYYSDGLSNVIYRVNIVPCIPVPLVMHVKTMQPLRLPPLCAQRDWFGTNVVQAVFPMAVDDIAWSEKEGLPRAAVDFPALVSAFYCFKTFFNNEQLSQETQIPFF